MRFLGHWKITFFRAKKRFLFYLAHYLTLFLVLFWPKTTQEKKYIFWPKAWVLTPLEKCDFWDFERLHFLGPKKVSFLSRTLLNIISSLILTENNSRKKTTFFDQKHGLTPLEKCDFWDFEKLHFLGPKKVSFLSRALFNNVSGLILTENNFRKKIHFLTKSMG